MNPVDVVFWAAVFSSACFLIAAFLIVFAPYMDSMIQKIKLKLEMWKTK